MKTKYPRGPRLNVTVDTDLIEISKERDSSHCMIAEAIRDVVPYAKSISVDLQTIRFSNPEKRLRYTYLTPRAVGVALVNFDQGVTPEPFSFTIQGPHVTTMAQRKPSGTAPRSRTLRQQEATKRAREVMKRTVIVPESGGKVARRVGGKTLPTAPFARRRAFGLRALTL